MICGIKTILTMLILFLLFFVANLQICANGDIVIQETGSSVFQPNQKIQGVYIDSVTFFREDYQRDKANSIKNISNPQNCGEYDIALSLINLTEYSNEDGIHFEFYVVRQQKDWFQIKLNIPSTANWKECHIHFLLSCNPNLIAGQIQADKMELFKFNDLDKKSVVISSLIDISQFANISGLFRIMPYLNGIKTKDKHLNFSLGVEGHEFKSPELNISTENPENIQEIELLMISYLIFNTPPFELSSVPDTVKTVAEILNDTTEHSHHSFIGSTGLKALYLEQENQPLSSDPILRQNIDSIQQQLFKQSFQIKGLALKFTQDPVILKVIGFGQEEEQCLIGDSCEAAGGFVGTQNGQTKCFKCKEERKFYSPQQSACICNPEFVLSTNGSCILPEQSCENNEQFIDGLCISLLLSLPQQCDTSTQVYNLREDKCECKSGYSQGMVQGKLVCKNCEQNFVLDQQEFECRCEGVVHEGKCIICDNLSEWSSESRRCECVPPTYLIEGRCQFCSANSRYDETNQSCRCRGGYTKFGMVCRKARLSDPFINFEITGL